MNDFNPNPDNWEYGTGRTQPPKSHGGLIALLLILVIFLTGIVTVLGILNIRLSRQLSATQMEAEAAIAFVREQECGPMITQPTGPEGGFQLPIQEPSPTESVPGTGLSRQEIYRQSLPSVVCVSAEGPGGAHWGTGVVLTQDGYLLTTAQAVEGALTVTVRLYDDREFPAQLVGMDSAADLAVLKIDAQDLIPALFGPSELALVGDSVVAIGAGHSSDHWYTMSVGILSGTDRQVELDGRSLELLQTDARMDGDSTGAPVYNELGQVIGIYSGHISSQVGPDYTLLVPTATVKTVVDQLLSQDFSPDKPRMGFQGEGLSKSVRSYYQLPAGVYITWVEPESPAGLCGLLPGDILLEVDGIQVDCMEDVSNVLFSHSPGDTVTVTLYRQGEQTVAELTLTGPEA